MPFLNSNSKWEFVGGYIKSAHIDLHLMVNTVQIGIALERTLQNVLNTY